MSFERFIETPSLDGDYCRDAVGPVSLPQPPVAPQVRLRRVAGVPDEADHEEDTEHGEDTVVENHDRYASQISCLSSFTWLLIR